MVTKTGTCSLRTALTTVGLVAAVLTAACSGGEITHGYVLSESALTQIQTGSSREQVLLVLGSPSTTSTVGGEAFYYITQRGEKPLTFMREELVDQRVLAVYFDDNGFVKEVANYGNEDGKVVDFISRKTKTGGRDYTFLAQLLRATPSLNR